MLFLLFVAIAMGCLWLYEIVDFGELLNIDGFPSPPRNESPLLWPYPCPVRVNRPDRLWSLGILQEQAGGAGGQDLILASAGWLSSWFLLLG